jgi:large subunit ribosomal protein L15
MPLVRRLPKRGFHSPFKVVFQIVNVETLEKLAVDGKVGSAMITPETLVKLGVVKKATVPVKVLGTGELKAKLEVSAHAFSKSAVQKIEAAGGTVLTISSTPKTNG